MTRIRVNPDILSQSSNGISGVSGEVKKTGEKVWRSAKDAPSYDGQFGPVVRAIAQGAVAEAQNHQSRLSNESVSLAKRSEAFLAADTPIKNIINRSVGFPIVGFGQISHILPFQNIIIQPRNLGISGNPVESSVSGNYPVGFVHETYGDAGKSTRLIDTLMDFENSPAGREMIQAAFAAGLLFIVKDSNGEVLAKWGKQDSRSEIEVSIGAINEKIEGPYNILGLYQHDTKKITLNEEHIGEEQLYSNVLIHEMQHAVDDRFSISEIMSSLKRAMVYGILELPEFVEALVNHDNHLGSKKIDELEAEFAQKITTNVKSEVNAYDIGYSMEGGSAEAEFGSLLDRNDGIYTKEEYEFIIYKRNYNLVYENQLNDLLKKDYSDGHEYEAIVKVDEIGAIQVVILPKSRLLAEWIC